MKKIKEFSKRMTREYQSKTRLNFKIVHNSREESFQDLCKKNNVS